MFSKGERVRNLENYVVYLHINKVNGKKYVGITSDNVEKRWGKGYYGNPKFYTDIVEYGWNNFEHIILYEGLEKEQARVIETSLIHYYNTIEEGYNIMEGRIPTEETKKKMSKAHERKVICITTNKIFNSQTEGAEFYNIQQSSISRCCKGKQKYCGKHNGKKLVWKYLEDYLREIEEQRS